MGRRATQSTPPPLPHSRIYGHAKQESELKYRSSPARQPDTCAFCSLPRRNMALRKPLTPEEKSAPVCVVCVTGATSFIGGAIVQRLLAAGHTVHATCRDPTKHSNVAHLQALPNAAGRLKLFAADALVDGSYDKAMSGCDYVIHCAAPVTFDVPKGKEDDYVIKPAVYGTRNVLDTVNRIETVKKVVLTSSVLAVYGEPHERGKGHMFTEDEWSIQCDAEHLTYSHAKKQAEKVAWEMHSRQNRWGLVSILPAVVLGPPLSSRESESVMLMTRLMDGSYWPLCPQMGMPWVDVEDVAAAHCLAMIKPNAEGRYIVSESSSRMDTLVNILRKNGFGRKLWLPFMRGPQYAVEYFAHLFGYDSFVIRSWYFKVPKMSNNKVRTDLGLEFLPLEQTVVEMANRLIGLGMVEENFFTSALSFLTAKTYAVLGYKALDESCKELEWVVGKKKSKPKLYLFDTQKAGKAD